MNAHKKSMALVLGGAFAATVAMAPVAGAAENPFALKSLSSGYMVAEHHENGGKMEDGKCGAGKCGSNMKKNKAEEGKCGAKEKEGSCGAEKKGKEGSCGGKEKEGSCGSKS